ncbi:DUF2207 domain-containing protein [Chitinophaga sedimenti]|uniref:DUF2207 domain-containing protein n=1 Tax=Chitinophaga sedimenti TaxID=2033606 RepID=UPI0020050EFE|nr:DUF2207 domain-containing protein [Chitinophaga sedimenti]MCK7554303.1 DUF2207 domain-containing protein [Chitinophaga sedimenti]
MMKHLCLLFFALFCVMGRLSAQDDGLHPYYSEGIILFHSDIDIARDGVVRVAETIRVYAAGDQIKRGIIREIPQYRTDKYGRKKRVKIHVVEVLKDSVTASYSEQEEGTNLNIRIGDPDVILGNGVYEYKIVYESRGHIGFFDGFDELYWNVTGNDWRLPIVKSSATVHLPGGAKVKQSACYTGVKGATDTDCTIEYDANGTPTFTTSTLLSPGAGFTIAIGFTAGIIQRPQPPGPWERLLEWFDIAKAYLLAVIGMLVLVPVLYRKWRKHGKDPDRKVVVARFDPPRNYSPAALRYIFTKSWTINPSRPPS